MMDKYRLPIMLLCLLFLFSSVMFASAKLRATAERAAKPAAKQTAILEVDDEAGAVRIIINGQEQARFDATGLHVREGVSYGGMLMDYGRAGYDGHAGASEKQAHAD